MLRLTRYARVVHQRKLPTTYFGFALCCRPDLVDLRKVRAQNARQNLDMAFSLAENEFGVTRLLDPEGQPVLPLSCFGRARLSRDGLMEPCTCRRCRHGGCQPARGGQPTRLLA